MCHYYSRAQQLGIILIESLVSSCVSDSLLNVLYSEDVSVSGEALLYCVGALKFLSGNATILGLLLDKNCMGVAQKLLQALCAVDDTNVKTAGHILVQVRLKFSIPELQPYFRDIFRFYNFSKVWLSENQKTKTCQ